MSCSNENSIDRTSVLQNDIFNFKYKGVEYFAEYNVVDSTMMFVDEEIANLICSLESNPYVSTLTYPNGLVEYFDSNKDFEEFVEKGEFSYRASSRFLAGSYLLSLTLKVYEDANFESTCITFTGPLSIPNMQNVYNQPSPAVPTDFNDKISSFQLTGTVDYSRILKLGTHGRL